MARPGKSSQAYVVMSTGGFVKVYSEHGSCRVSCFLRNKQDIYMFAPLSMLGPQQLSMGVLGSAKNYLRR
jgi:hypothetical protein